MNGLNKLLQEKMSLKEALKHPINLAYISGFIANVIVQCLIFYYQGSHFTRFLITCTFFMGIASNCYLLIHHKKNLCLLFQLGIALINGGLCFLWDSSSLIQTITFGRYLIIMFLTMILAQATPSQVEEKQIELDALADYFNEKRNKRKDT